MNDYALSIVFTSPEQAGVALKNSVAPYCRQQWARGVQRLSVVIQPESDARSLRQNAFYWGVVLKEVSQQAKIAGTGATPDGWHLYFKREHLGYNFKKTLLPGKRRPSVIKTLRSSADLSVKGMSEYLEKVIAQSVADFGVSFSERNWERYR